MTPFGAPRVAGARASCQTTRVDPRRRSLHEGKSMLAFLKALFWPAGVVAEAPIASPESTQPAVDGAQLRFRPQLISELRAEQNELLKIYGRLVAAHQIGQFDLAVGHLHEFTTLL